MIKIGNVVKVGGMWCGIVEDIAYGTHNTVMLISSLKDAFRGRGKSEWLVFDEKMIVLAEKKDYERDKSRYEMVLDKFLVECQDIQDRIERVLDG